jgi:hypothetical protein
MTIEQLATITRLNKKFIEALEEGRRDKLPGQVYLKPFTKTCAEVLDLDLKDLYKIINGEIGDDEQNGRRLEFPEEKKKRFDYKLPVVLLIAVTIVGIIYVTIITREKIPVDTTPQVIIPAGTTMVRGEIKWSRPWERPAHYRMGPLKQNLILLTTDSVVVFVMSSGDTLFNGILIADQRRMFSSEDEFTLSLSRNDCVTAIVNGQKDTLIGSSGGKLENYTIGKREDQ